jgi:hypothetical protein
MVAGTAAMQTDYAFVQSSQLSVVAGSSLIDASVTYALSARMSPRMLESLKNPYYQVNSHEA